MKKITSLLLALTLSVTLFTGCSTSNANSQAAQHAFIQMAAATGTQLALTPPTGKPEYALYFVGAEQALFTISTGTNAITASTVEDSLHLAGVTNPVVSLAIVNAITLGNALVTANAGTNENAKVIAIKQVAGDVAAGIQQGLSVSGQAALKSQ